MLMWLLLLLLDVITLLVFPLLLQLLPLLHLHTVDAIVAAEAAGPLQPVLL
jgi:hypothetical protein